MNSRNVLEASRLYLDTTVFVNFGERGAIIPLVSGLGARARIVNEVNEEIKRITPEPEFPFLSTLGMIRGWPPVPPVELTAAQMAEVLDIKNAVKQKGDHPLKDLGEISTVIAACADGRAPVASDDGLAAKLCSTRELRIVRSNELAATVGVEYSSRTDTDR